MHPGAQPKIGRDGQPTLNAEDQHVLKASLMFHDLRRSAMRSLDRDTQPVAMAITGHNPAGVYRRYRIVNEDDIRMALERVQSGNRAQGCEPRDGRRLKNTDNIRTNESGTAGGGGPQFQWCAREESNLRPSD